MATTKLYYLRGLFLTFLEPNDIVDKFSETGIFKNVGIQIRSIQGNDDESRRRRVKIFLQSFENLDPEIGNKYQELVDVLDADRDYKWLVPFLKDHEVLDPQVIHRLERLQKPDKVKGILQLIFPALTDINVTAVMYQMPEVFNDLDREEISMVVERSGNHAALYKLLHKAIYKPPDWIESFTDAVEKENYNAATPMFEGTQYATLADALRDYFFAFNEGVLNSGATEERMDFEECAEPMLERAACPVRSTESQMRRLHMATSTSKEIETLDKQTSCKPIHGNAAVTEPMNDKLESTLFEYQKELCKLALTNDSPSVVICAPTGSGKTIVAAHIIDQHLKENRSGKVAFFTPNGGLAEQQCLKMEKYMPERKERKTIVMLRGNMENDIGKDFPRKIYSSELIVMTPQILLNCLENKAVRSIFDFSMMIFDECHHARASHPYSEILKKYLEGKEKKENPIQIIGLTATLGIGSAEDEEEAKANIFRLLGILDATGGIVTVRGSTNKDELNDKCPAALESTEYITHDEEDPFKDVIKGAVNGILDSITDMKALAELNIPGPVGHTGSLEKEFEGWCQKLRVAAEGRVDGQVGLGEEAKVSTLGRDTKSCADTLLRLKRAHDLCCNCQPSDAIHQIEQFVSNRFKEHHEKNTKLEMTVYGLLNSTIEELKKCVEDAENKMLRLIEKKIKQKQQEDPDFRCMIMVSRRLYAAYLQKWIEESKLLKELGARIYIGIGTKSTSELPGMTHKKQSETIEGFKKGLYKVLVCTPDAAGEGIDIALCNLVVTIDCVRDEVRRIQLRGRARKQNSEVLYILFRNDGTMKDSLPLAKQLLMERATRRIEKMCICDPREYKSQLFEGRQKATGQMQATQLKKRNAPIAQVGRRDSFLCRGCSEYVCCTDQLIRMNGNHHTVHDANFRSKYTRTRHDSKGGFCGSTTMRHVYRIRCTECKCDWGNEVAWKEYLVPIISIRGFKIKDSRGKVHLPSKWKNTRLRIPESKDKDLCNELFEKCNGVVDENGDCAA